MDQLEEIKKRLNLVDLISESITLKKAGRNFKGLCPFHGEKSPSFVVSPERQIWHCFGCQKGGDAFTFLMEMDRLDFPEALKILAARTGVTLEQQPQFSGKQKIRERLLQIHHLTAELYQYLLVKHPIGEHARLYVKERGMTPELIKTFGLGYAPNAWNTVTKFLQKKGFTSEEMEQSGLALMGKMGLYDRFRGRIMFPLKNHRAETIAFSGRILEKEAKEAKYINSPETPLYVKGDTLYGLEVTKEYIRKSGAAIVVEGEFDVISSFQAGVTNVVAIKGSALTPAQINLLKRFTEHIILSLDRDAAGDAAARRGIELADRAGMEIKVVQIPSGKDPDEAARENPLEWKKAVKQAEAFYDFVIDSAANRYGITEAFGKKKITDEVLPLVAKIGNTIVQAHYIKLLATRLNLPEEKIAEALRRFNKPVAVGQTQPTPVVHLDQEALLEEHLLTLVVQSQDAKLLLDAICARLDPSDFTHPAVKKIFMLLIDYGTEHETLDLNDFSKSVPEELVPMFDRLSLEDISAFLTLESLQQELAKTVVNKLRMQLRRKITEISTQLTQAEKNEDFPSLEKLKAEYRAATVRLKDLLR